MHPKRPRLNAELYIGPHRSFLTFCTHDRQRFFERREAVELVRGQILHAATDADVAVAAYCFMPDHVHLLVSGESEAADALKFAHHAKQRSASAFTSRWWMRLWEPSFYDRVLRDEDATISVARYIVENPVRARLVESPHEYPFLGSDRYSIDQMLEAVRWQP